VLNVELQRDGVFIDSAVALTDAGGVDAKEAATGSV
jgi:hypothetical protein